MKRDLNNNNDDLYRKAYERLEEEPSANVWDKVAAKLDNRDAQYYQQKSIRWKRTSLLLLLLLGTVLLTGVLYTATKKTEPKYVGVNRNDKNIRADNRTQPQAFSNDSNTIHQNINQRNVYATEPYRKSNSDTGASLLQSAATEQLVNVSQQMDARFGKQHSKPLQNTSVDSEAVVKQTTSSTESNTYSTNKVAQKQLAVQKNADDTGKNKESAYVQNSAITQQKNRAAFIAKQDAAYKQNKVFAKQQNTLASILKKKSSFEKNNEQSSTYQPNRIGDERDDLLPLQTLTLNSFFPYSISQKETVDSITLAQVTTTITRVLKKESAVIEASTSSAKKTVRIAQPLTKRLQLTAYASLDFSEYHLDDDDDHNNNQQPASHREDRHKIGDRENHGFSFSAGVSARLQVAKKISLKSGLNYSNTTININPQTLYAVQDGNQGVAYKFVTSSGYAYVKTASGNMLTVGDSAKANVSQNQLQFLSIPLMIGYTMYTSRRFSIIPSFGAAANLLLGTQVKTEIDEPAAKESITITQLNGLQHWYPSLLADAEMQYHFKPTMSLNFIPSFRYAVSPLTQNNAVKTSPYSFGLGLGFTYHF